MTVNERLAAAGLLAQFDAAINRGARQAAVDVLRRVDLDASQAVGTVDAILANPSMYGYLPLGEGGP